MAILIRGQLKSNWEEVRPQADIFRQESYTFQNLIGANDSPEFSVEASRYRLYAGYGDPWSHRALVVHALKNLEHAIPLSIVDPVLSDRGWRYNKPSEHFPDVGVSWKYLHELYTATDPKFTGRVTVPLLWDSRTEKIVNNESGDIMRMFNSVFAPCSDPMFDLYPDGLAQEIDRINDFIFDNINNGVYKMGFSTSQPLYKNCSEALFSALNEIEERLSCSRYLLGSCLTESDIRLFVTLVRFDTIYYPYLKCNKKRLQDYTNLWPYTREIYQLPGVKESVKLDFIKKTYYGLNYLNPTQVIPDGPDIDFDEPSKTVQYKIFSAPFS